MTRRCPELGLLPTAPIGSHALPAIYLIALERIGRGDLGETDLREVVEDASQLAILDQERSGLTVVSDGEVRRHDFILSFYGRLHGLRTLPARRRLGPHLYDSTPIYEVEDRLSAPEGLGTVAEFEFASGRSRRPVKVACPGPLTLSQPMRLVGGYRDREELLWGLAEIVNAELRRLVDAGCGFVQVDESSHATYWASPSRFVELFNRTVEGVEARIALHLCFGNLRGRPHSPRSYRQLLPGLHQARADVLFLEFANREMAEVDEFARADLPQDLGAGVVDVKSYHRERPEEVADRLRRVLRDVPAERVWAVPDCGLWETPRWLAVAKLRALAAGAEMVRRELEG
ncbi:MAG TPA: cobalamin-independent methionine synthase II family protein [Candidatus Dormibacteraeota bacterium]|nr:cobalamin-independent methionine synthase II family protein [Candidatus Dormibacteraeota bacterium]